MLPWFLRDHFVPPPGIALETAAAAGFDVQPILTEQMLCDLEKNEGENLGVSQHRIGVK